MANIFFLAFILLSFPFFIKLKKSNTIWWNFNLIFVNILFWYILYEKRLNSSFSTRFIKFCKHSIYGIPLWKGTFQCPNPSFVNLLVLNSTLACSRRILSGIILASSLHPLKIFLKKVPMKFRFNSNFTTIMKEIISLSNKLSNSLLGKIVIYR